MNLNKTISALRVIGAAVDAGQAYLCKEGAEIAEFMALACAHMERYGDCPEALETACEYACTYDAPDDEAVYVSRDQNNDMDCIDARVSARESLLRTIQCEERNSVYASIRRDPRYQTVSERLQTS